jgi:hypothetical protein
MPASGSPAWRNAAVRGRPNSPVTRGHLETRRENYSAKSGLLRVLTSVHSSQNTSHNSELMRQTFATPKTLENQGNRFLSQNLQLLRHEAWRTFRTLQRAKWPSMTRLLGLPLSGQPNVVDGSAARRTARPPGVEASEKSDPRPKLCVIGSGTRTSCAFRRLGISSLCRSGSDFPRNFRGLRLAGSDLPPGLTACL